MGLALLLPVAGDELDLLVRHEHALGADRLGHVRRLPEEVAAAEELLGAGHVDDRARVDRRRGRERDARRDVRLDEPGDDVDRRALRRDDEVDPRSARELRDAGDRFLHLDRRGHHEVRELVDDDDDVRDPVLSGPRLVVALDVARGRAREEPVAPVHLADRPVERVEDLVVVRDDRHDEVRDAVEGGELDALGVGEDDPDLVGRRLQEQARDHRVDADALPRAGLAGDEEMRELCEVRHDRGACDVATERHGELGARAAEIGALRDVTERDEADREVRDLDADDALARDRRLDAQAARGQRQGEVVRERLDPRELHARGGLELVARHHGPDAHRDDLRADAKVRERLLDDAHVPADLALARSGGGALLEEIDRRQRPRLLRRRRVQHALGRDRRAGQSGDGRRERSSGRRFEGLR